MPCLGRFPAASLAAFILLAAALPAQTVTPAAAEPAANPVPVTQGTEPAKKSEQVLVLSPFTVVADTKGYQSFSTLSGTRLNSKLEDLGSSITVVTKQQMIDTAVLDLNDVFRYEASTEGTSNYTQFTPNRNGGVIDGTSNDPARANRIRGVGSPISGSGVNIAIGNFTSNSKIPMDIYNIESVEILRGPNSNLFGLGAAAGTVNLVPLQANPSRSSAQATFRIDSQGGYRVSVDFNKPLIQDKLALRFAGVDEAKGFQLEPSEEEIRRYYGAVFYRPFPNTKITASYEQYDNSYRRPNSLTPRDTTAEWNAAGRPTWDPTTQRVTLSNGTVSGPYAVTNENLLLPSGLMAGIDYGKLITWLDTTGVQYFTQSRTANPITSGTPSPYTNNSNVRYLQTGTDILRRKANPYPLFFATATNDKSVYDWENVNYIAANHGQDEATTARVELEQIVYSSPTHLLALRGGLFMQDFQRETDILIDNTDTILYVDVNSKLLDGKANPNFLRPFVEAPGGPQSQRIPEESTIKNADVAYQYTPGQLPRWLSWIGTQRLALHLEDNRTDESTYTYAQYVSDPHAWINPTNYVSGNPIAQRYYLGDNQGQNIDYGAYPVTNINGNYNLNWLNNLTGQWVSEPTVVSQLGRTGTIRRQVVIRTVSLVAQSNFLNDRVVTTLGWRRDRRDQRDSLAAAVDPATGQVNYKNYDTWQPWITETTGPLGDATRASQEGDTKTYGIVVKPTKWLNLYYNRSDSFFPQVVRYSMDLKGVIPNAKGTGTDYGITFTALDGKLGVKLNRYEVVDDGTRAGEVGTIGNRTFRLEGRQEGNGIRDNNGFYPWALNLSNSRFAAQGITPTAAQSASAVAKIMGVTDDWMTTFLAAGPGQPQTNGLSTVVSEGYELEVTYNPTRNWRIKFTGAQQQAMDAAIGPEQFNYWQERLPVWTTAKDDSGVLWWTKVPAAGGDTPETAYYNGLLSPYLFATANVGKPRSQVREYRWGVLTNYEFSTGRLKNFSIGGSIRWEDEGAIGFYGKPPSTLPGSFKGVVLELDPEKPIYDDSRFYYDFSMGYRFRLFKDKLRGNIQLNIRDVFEDGRLQGVAANPDGAMYAIRIVEPRRFILTTTFDF